MSNSSPGPTPKGPSDRFNSLDCEIIELQGVDDTTVRPMDPKFVRMVLEERERRERLLREMAAEPQPPPAETDTVP